jgi:hypothetical protein
MKILKTWAVISLTLIFIGFIGMMGNVDGRMNPIQSNIEWLNFFLGVFICSGMNLFTVMAISLAWKGWD